MYTSLSPALATMLVLLALLGFGYNIALRAPAPLLDLVCLASSTLLVTAALYDRRFKSALEKRIPQWLRKSSTASTWRTCPFCF